MYLKKRNQEQVVLDMLRSGAGWVSGMDFLNLEKPITQYHARIWGLQKKGYEIEGRFKEGCNFKEYQLIIT